MSYPIECVEAYLIHFPLPDGVEFDPELGMLVWDDDVESDFADGITTRFIYQLPVFAHNWERCRRLESALSQIVRDLPSNRDWLDPALEAEARKILEES